MTVLFKICGCALIGGVCAAVLKGSAKGVGVSVAVFSSLLILVSVINRFSGAILSVNQMMTESGMGTYGKVMVKSLGVGVVVNTVSSICNDMGESSISEGVLFAGKIEILLICLPVISEMLSLIKDLIV